MFLCARMLKRVRPTLHPCARLLQTQLTLEEVEALQHRFPEPLKQFKGLLQEASFALQDVEPSRYTLKHDSLKYAKDGVGGTLWHSNLEVNWPEHFTVDGVGTSKTEATRLTYLQACKKILELRGPEKLPLCLPNNEASKLLCDAYSIISQDLNLPELPPQFIIERVPELEGWRCKLKLIWPQDMEFSSLGWRKNVAKDIAAQKALEHLQKLNVLTQDYKPILVTTEQQEHYQREKNGPISFSLDPAMKEEITNIVERFKSLRQDDLQTVSSTEDLTPLDIMTGRDVVPYDIMTGRPYEEQDWSANNTDLYNLFQHRQTSPQTQVAWIRKVRQALPIFAKKEEILRTIEEDPVVLIHGQTGCGKTTQVPQYILEKAAMDGHGSDVNIVVTQPRRISALSIAGSVAHELGEPLGCTVGYQIRLDKILPSRRRGAILFCSTGILLRHLQANRGELPGVTHIIVDEAHERDIQIDLLLTLLREKVRHPDSKLRLILMSASFNTKLFSSYFNYCPVVDVPGMSFPVKEHYLPEILQELGQDPNSFWEGTMFTEQLGHLICQVVKHIDDSRPPGKAILVFLPGWQEIKWVHDQLKDNPGLLLLPTHSRLSPTEQMAIFKPAPTGLRKVVLATNIAESSITVEDVVYVVDPGLHKEAYIHRSAPSLRSCWASQANIVQRRGRAGRVLPGEAFHLFTKETLASMDPHPCPEILRVPLEGIILEAMAFIPEGQSVKDLLATTPQPPSYRAINQGLEELRRLEMITYNEKLTLMGKMAAWLPTNDPRLAKALLLSLYFRCLDPVLTVVSVLTALKDLFLADLSNREEVMEAKRKLSTTPHSDHLTWVNVWDHWSEHPDPEDFCEKHLLNSSSLHFVQGLRMMYLDLMANAGYLTGTENSEEANNLALATLSAAFFPNVFRVQRGIIRNHRHIPSACLLTTFFRKGEHIHVSKDSMLSDTMKHQDWKLIIYHHALNSKERSSLVVREATAIPTSLMAVLGGPWQISHMDARENIELHSVNYPLLQLTCPNLEDAKLMNELYDCYKHSLDNFLRNLLNKTESEPWNQLNLDLVNCFAKLASFQEPVESKK